MATYESKKYLLMTTDPVHIGTGGYRLGRVDNTIVREPGTQIPKIPGTALHGAIRSYAAQLYETPEAAGQKQDTVSSPNENPVCYTFGYIKTTQENNQTKSEEKEEKTVAYSGVVSIFDAHILLFPVYSMLGPVWVTTLDRLKDAGFSVSKTTSDNSNDNSVIEQEPCPGKVFSTFDRSEPLNLGWLMVEIENSPIKIELSNKSKCQELSSNERWTNVRDKLVIINNALFSQIVNSNLEVRTSVCINPETGAAEEGALFTYEAIPRATFLTMDVVLDDYRENFPNEKAGSGKTDKNNPLPCGKWQGPLDVVRAGLKMVEYLGVGGMGTRGFGRMAIVEEITCDILSPLRESGSKQI